LFQALLCSLREFIDDLDAVNPSDQFGEHRRLIAETGTDFEDHVVGLGLKQVRHHRDDQRLRDRLVEADRQRPVEVSVGLDLDRHKLVPGHLGHRPEDSIVQCGLAKLSDEVVRDLSDRRNHLSPLVLKIYSAHEAPSSSERGRRMFASGQAQPANPLQHG
jgi:hypothetical protein